MILQVKSPRLATTSHVYNRTLQHVSAKIISLNLSALNSHDLKLYIHNAPDLTMTDSATYSLLLIR